MGSPTSATAPCRPLTGSSTSKLPISLSSLTTTLLFALPSFVGAVNLDCKNIPAQGKNFDLGKLGGAHKLHWEAQTDNPLSRNEITWEVDICEPLKWDKGTGKKDNCPHGTFICGINSQNTLDGNTTLGYIPIAGNYKMQNGRTLDPQFTLFRESGSHADADREGFRAELHGGRVPFTDKHGKDQKAIIEFVCDRERTGLEGDEKDDGEKEKDDGDGDRKDGEEGDKKEGDEDDKKNAEKHSLSKRADGNTCYDADSNRSLKFCSYKEEKTDKDKFIDVLRLEWHTKYACEDYEDNGEDGGKKGSHWGFFTWFIIILFLAIAAYLIFGSWLNYNRYGARGWDLLPHGDTIRDIPYILKDLGRRVVGSVQGPGSRGGYSAV